jgi:adenine-specific DNA glycosylase
MLDGLVLARASELRQPEREDHFLRMFGQSDRQIADSNSEEGSVPQVLMLMNGEAQKVMRNPRSLVLATALKQETPEAKVESLYLSFLSRRPTAAEMAAAKEGLAGGLTAADLTWVLFNSREFVFVQ